MYGEYVRNYNVKLCIFCLACYFILLYTHGIIYQLNTLCIYIDKIYVFQIFLNIFKESFIVVITQLHV